MGTFPNQADGGSTDREAPDGVATGPHGRGSGGESGGAAYPTGHKPEDSVGGAAGNGAVKYFGSGQAGEDHDESATPNSPAGS